MKTYLFVAAFLDELRPFYTWLVQHARPHKESPLYSISIQKKEIQERILAEERDSAAVRDSAVPNSGAKQDSAVPLLQCFLYDSPRSHTISIALLVTGIGKVAAASAVAAAASQVTTSRPDLVIIKVGSVLGASPALSFGDIARCTMFAQHDLHYGPIHKKQKVSVKKKLQCAQDLDAVIEEDALAEIANRVTLREDGYHSAALCCSGDLFVKLQRKPVAQGVATYELPPHLSSCLEQIQEEQESSLPVLVDMENAAVFHAASLCKTPLLVLSFVLDSVSDAKALDFSAAMQRLSESIGAFCVALVEHLDLQDKSSNREVER